MSAELTPGCAVEVRQAWAAGCSPSWSGGYTQEEAELERAQEEAAFERGSKAVYRELLSSALRGLGREAIPEGPEAMQQRIAQLEMCLTEARAQLRILCADFGDNEWDDEDYLPDVIEKHLGKYLRAT